MGMGTARLAERFRALKARGEGALIAYLMAGDPDLERSFAYARAAIEGGADILELGIPFSDPVADGPTIQAAGQRALRAGTTPRRVLELVRALRERTDVPDVSDVPIVLMGYYNPIFRLEEARFVEAAVAAGADGVIVPDLPLEEAGPLLEAARARDFALIFLATPETPETRLRRLGEASRGFLYLVGRYGTTGAREALAPQTVELIRRARRALPEGLPLAVGFGLARPEHVRGVIQAGADGAVVGSRLVLEVERNAPPERLRALVGALKAATRR